MVVKSMVDNIDSCKCGSELTKSDLALSKLFKITPPECEYCISLGLLISLNEFHRVLDANQRIKARRKLARSDYRKYIQSLQQKSLMFY
jgi:hypothetical protein